jgi:predicted nucleotide-binding protein
VSGTRRPADPPERPTLLVDHDQAQAVLNRHVEQGTSLLADASGVTDRGTYGEWRGRFDRWRSVTEAAVRSIYSTDEPSKAFASSVSHTFRRMGQTEDDTFAYQQDVIPRGMNTLTALVESLEYTPTTAPFESPAVGRVVEDSRGDGIFLVHGHDEAAKQTVARFLDLATKPGVTILDEQPDEGRTIIEKFEQHAAKAGYAVVLLTGDDQGRRQGTEDWQPRARQNVVLELGFFIAKLGRGHVAMLYAEGVERPSDIDGVLYVKLDGEGAWKAKLAREMLNAGVAIDAAKALTA